MIIRYSYKNWSLKYCDGVLEVMCILEDQTLTREYDVPMVDHIQCDNEYMYLFDDSNNNMIQFKMEYGDCIIGDIFTCGGEHVDSIACHDFNDDVVIDKITKSETIQRLFGTDDIKEI